MAFFYRLLLVLAFFAIAPLHAQDTLTKPKTTQDQTTNAQDTVKIKHDQMYKRLEDYSKRRGFTKFLHKLLFRPVKEKEPSKSRKKTERGAPELQTSSKKYQGKVVLEFCATLTTVKSLVRKA